MQALDSEVLRESSTERVSFSRLSIRCWGNMIENNRDPVWIMNFEEISALSCVEVGIEHDDGIDVDNH
jgi:hypothetical protein